ncbi:MAG: metallophosphoesterase [Myxococcales bacterium]|nr:metallophosphoesterase [Myxococcales bacterium]
MLTYLAWWSCAQLAPSPPEPATVEPVERGSAALTFAVTGDAPYDPPGATEELERLRADVATLTGVDFVVHLGDLKTGRSPCVDTTYTNVAEVMCGAAVPAFVIPGDNEWNDCERTKDEGFDTVEGWRHWDAAFGAASERCPTLTPPVPWTVRTQVRPTFDWWPGRHTGAFAFDRAGVRVVGLSLPSFFANGHGLPGEKGRTVQSLAISWLSTALDRAPAEIAAAVVVLHADAERDGSKQERFVEALRLIAGTFDRPVLVVVGDTHVYEERRPFEGLDLRYVVITQGGKEAPLTVAVHPGAGSAAEVFQLTRGQAH